MDSKHNLRKALAAGAVTIAALGSVLLGGAGAAQAAASITISPGTYSAGADRHRELQRVPGERPGRRDHLQGAGDDGHR